MARLRLGSKQVDALQVWAFDPAITEWAEDFPDDEENAPESLRLVRDHLVFDDADQDAVWRFLVDRANAVDAHVEYLREQGEPLEDFAQDREAIQAVASRVLREGKHRTAPCCVECGRVCACVYTRDGARRCSPCAGVGCLRCKDEVRERPTGVPLTADNVVDAEECHDSWGTHVRVGTNAWDVRGVVRGAVRLTDYAMVTDAPHYGTVVTKWRKP